MSPQTELRLLNKLDFLIPVNRALEYLETQQRKLNSRRAENTTLALVRALQKIETEKCNKILQTL